LGGLKEQGKYEEEKGSGKRVRTWKEEERGQCLHFCYCFVEVASPGNNSDIRPSDL